MSGGSVTQWLSGLARGDGNAAREIWQRYFERLVRLARKRLGDARPGGTDEEDVALSALDGFLRGAAAGNFPHLNDREDLWKVLVTVTARRALDHQRREGRQKRGGGAVRGETVFAAGDDADAQAGINRVLGREPTPELAAMMAEDCERLLNQLDDVSLRKVAQRKLEGYTNEEIAKEMNCALRTVKRRLAAIRARWSREVET
jgi:RNA polymerase sigma factor (sigma-70 family)